MPDWRRRQGRDYPLPCLLAIMVLAAISGIVHGQRDLAALSATLTGSQLRTLRSYTRPFDYRLDNTFNFGSLLVRLMAPHYDQARKERERIRAAEMFENGTRQAEVARRLCVSRQTVSRWHRVWLSGGNVALEIKNWVGRQYALNPEQIEELIDALKAGALAAGFPKEKWTLKQAADLIIQRFGVTYHEAHVSKILASLRYQGHHF